MASDEIPVVPDSTSFSYLNEGAANIVYKISDRDPTPASSVLDQYGDGTPPPSEVDPDTDHYQDKIEQLFDEKLLRLRKDLPTTLPVASSHEAWQRVIAPLFDSDDIVEQTLVRLGPAQVIERLNQELRDWEQGPAQGFQNTRPPNRQGVYLADEEFGLLITDMTPGVDGEVTIEFKPKWLAQSPSAPEYAVRCRQCARVARTNAERARNGEPLQKSFCPLDLITCTNEDSHRAAEALTWSGIHHETFFRLHEWIKDDSLLRRLRDLQELLDPIGVLENDKNDENFRAAMTLRDCTVFVRIADPDNYTDVVEARIGDLDLKSPDKAEYWKETENALIDEGWYTGTEPVQYQQPMTCQLSPDRDGDPMARPFPLTRS